jgi:hypothetical protein
MDISIRHPRFFLLYISYKTTFCQQNILKLSLGRFLRNLFQDGQNSLNVICFSDSNFCLHGFCFLVIKTQMGDFQKIEDFIFRE